MEGCGVAVFVLVGVGVFGLVALAGLCSARERAETAAISARLADRLKGTVVRGGSYRFPWIRFEVHGRAAHFRHGEGSGVPYVSVEVDLQGRSPGTLKIYLDGTPWAAQMAVHYGPQDLRIGDPGFDQAFVVKSAPETLAARLFSPERRARLVAALASLRRYGELRVDLSRERLRVEVAGASPTERIVPEAVEAAAELVSAVLEVAPVAEVQWVEESRPGGGGLCQVCGSEMREEVVHCARCRTAHHEECWRWTGECSTFACRETRYVADGRVVRPPPRSQTPRDWLEEETERDRRETGGGLRARVGDLPAVEESLRRFERRQEERGRRG